MPAGWAAPRRWTPDKEDEVMIPLYGCELRLRYERAWVGAEPRTGTVASRRPWEGRVRHLPPQPQSAGVAASGRAPVRAAHQEGRQPLAAHFSGAHGRGHSNRSLGAWLSKVASLHPCGDTGKRHHTLDDVGADRAPQGEVLGREGDHKHREGSAQPQSKGTGTSTLGILA